MILSGFVFDGILVGAEGQCPPLNPGGGLWKNKAALIKEVNERLVVCINRERPAKRELVKPLYAIDDGESLLIQLGISTLGWREGSGRECNRLLRPILKLVGEDGTDTVGGGIA